MGPIFRPFKSFPCRVIVLKQWNNQLQVVLLILDSIAVGVLRAIPLNCLFPVPVAFLSVLCPQDQNLRCET